MTIKGAIFDLDGTLIDSMSIYDHVYNDYLSALGVSPAPTLREDVRQRDAHQISEFLHQTYLPAMPEPEVFSGINRLLEQYYFHEIPLKPGVRALLDALRSRRVPLAVATATDRYLTEGALKNNGISEYFGRVFTCAEENTGKEKPDIFLKAAAFLGTAPGETAVFEDALYAMRSAKAAGFTVAGVADLSNEGAREEILLTADYFFRSIEEGTVLI
jgi:HAD superfamily hydrolase (TIGR01509 family)